MKVTVADNSMRSYLHVGDEIEFAKGEPIPNGRICLARYQGRERIRQVFKEGDNYRLKCLNPIYADRTEYVPV